MKHLFTLIICLTAAAVTMGQRPIKVLLDQQVNGLDFKLNVDYTAEEGYKYRPQRLQYYVSNPIIIHDGGQETIVSKAYFLVNGGEGTTLDLGIVPNVTQVEGLQFSIGVDSARNHLDPAIYPEGHPLAYQDPSMHWGWVSGYRFIAYEGKSGPSMQYIWELHTIGNELYRTITLQTGAVESDDELIIPLIADYGKLLKDIDVSGGLYAHGNLGPCTTISDNIWQHVFSSIISSLPDKDDPKTELTLLPNPSYGFGQILTHVPHTGEWQVIMRNVSGMIVHQYDPGLGLSLQPMPALQSGMYWVSLLKDGHHVQTLKWIIHQ